MDVAVSVRRPVVEDVAGTRLTLLAELLIERRRLRKVFFPPTRRPKVAPLPKYDLRPVDVRLAEAEALDCDYETKKNIKNAILQSERDFG